MQRSSFFLHEKILWIPCLLWLNFFFFSCKSNRPNLSGVEVNLEVKRFEQELFAINDLNRDEAINRMVAGYGDFFTFYFNDFRWNTPTDSLQTWRDSLVAYVSDPLLRTLFDSVNHRFQDFSPHGSALTEALRYYRLHFPEALIPRLITVINSPGHGAFTYGDSVLCIALEDYMDPEFSYYRFLDIPDYLLRRFRPGYIVPNAMHVLITRDFPYDLMGKNLLDAMIYNGKVMYLKSQVMPEAADTLVTGFSSADLDWCRDNEKEIWKFFLSKNLLYSTDPLEYLKYVNDGPTTSGMPPESPGNIGSWLGWRIVGAYMKRFPATPLQQLMLDEDGQQILTESRYKP